MEKIISIGRCAGDAEVDLRLQVAAEVVGRENNRVTGEGLPNILTRCPRWKHGLVVIGNKRPVVRGRTGLLPVAWIDT